MDEEEEEEDEEEEGEESDEGEEGEEDDNRTIADTLVLECLERALASERTWACDSCNFRNNITLSCDTLTGEEETKRDDDSSPALLCRRAQSRSILSRVTDVL